VIEERSRLKNLRDGAQGIIPGIYFADRRLVSEFVKEGVFELIGNSIAC